MKLSKYGANYVITIPTYDEPRPSKTRKSLVVASSRGLRKSKRRIDGRNILYVANVFYYPAAKPQASLNNSRKKPIKPIMAPRQSRRRRQR
jgi:hypothetical protein